MTDEPKLPGTCKYSDDPHTLRGCCENWLAASPVVQSEPDGGCVCGHKIGYHADRACSVLGCECPEYLDKMGDAPDRWRPTVVPSRESTLPELDELLKAAKAANEGEWSNVEDYPTIILGPQGQICNVRGYGRDMDETIARYIIAAQPAAVIEIISALAAARAQVADLEARLRSYVLSYEEDAKVNAELAAQVAEQSEELNAISKAIGRPLISAKPLLAGVMELAAQVALLQQQEPASEAWERGQIAMRDDLARMLDESIEWVSIHGSIRNAAPLPYAPPEKETGV